MTEGFLTGNYVRSLPPVSVVGIDEAPGSLIELSSGGIFACSRSSRIPAYH